jgi:hypothetical protein
MLLDLVVRLVRVDYSHQARELYQERLPRAKGAEKTTLQTQMMAMDIYGVKITIQEQNHPTPTLGINVPRRKRTEKFPVTKLPRVQKAIWILLNRIGQVETMERISQGIPQKRKAS